jgi:SAM-dependent methyltransferase
MSDHFDQTGIEQNKDWFSGNTDYSERQERMPYYGYIRLMVTREIAGQNRVLDIGNGGFFNYDTTLARAVTAVDLFVKDGPGPTPNTVFKSGSILDLPFADGSFDCCLLQNVLHHVTGNSVKENRRNLKRCLEEMFRCTAPGGKAVLLESTVPPWFYAAATPSPSSSPRSRSWGRPRRPATSCRNTPWRPRAACASSSSATPGPPA